MTAHAGTDEPAPARSQTPVVQGFYDERTSSIQYVASCPTTRQCAIIDPVLDFDLKSGATASVNADQLLAYIADQGLSVQWILDTHPHADHLSAADYLTRRTGAPTGIGARVVEVQALWRDIYGWTDFPCDGSQWSRLFVDGEAFRIGEIAGRVIHSPGHTLASVTYVVGDAAFVHDTLFMPDTGTARTDFPGGSAARLYRSISDILDLPDGTRLFTGHDYKAGGRAPRWESTVAEQRVTNVHFASAPTVEQFVALREARDKTLPMPQLLLLALQVNVCAGRVPEPDEKGRRFLRYPLNAFAGAIW